MDNHTSYNVYHLSTGDLDFAGPSTVSTAGSKHSHGDPSAPHDLQRWPEPTMVWALPSTNSLRT
jgi:hypothetical protein